MNKKHEPSNPHSLTLKSSLQSSLSLSPKTTLSPSNQNNRFSDTLPPPAYTIQPTQAKQAKQAIQAQTKQGKQVKFQSLTPQSEENRMMLTKPHSPRTNLNTLLEKPAHLFLHNSTIKNTYSHMVTPFFPAHEQTGIGGGRGGVKESEAIQEQIALFESGDQIMDEPEVDYATIGGRACQNYKTLDFIHKTIEIEKREIEEANRVCVFLEDFFSFLETA